MEAPWTSILSSCILALALLLALHFGPAGGSFRLHAASGAAGRESLLTLNYTSKILVVASLDQGCHHPANEMRNELYGSFHRSYLPALEGEVRAAALPPHAPFHRNAQILAVFHKLLESGL